MSLNIALFYITFQIFGTAKLALLNINLTLWLRMRSASSHLLTKALTSWIPPQASHCTVTAKYSLLLTPHLLSKLTVCQTLLLAHSGRRWLWLSWGELLSQSCKAGGSVPPGYWMDEEDVSAHAGTQLLLDALNVPDTWLLRALLRLISLNLLSHERTSDWHLHSSSK